MAGGELAATNDVGWGECVACGTISTWLWPAEFVELLAAGGGLWLPAAN